MAKDAIVSDEMAKKFATEKDTPCTRWVKSEGLEIQSAMYVRNLHTVELKPWARRGGRGRRRHSPLPTSPSMPCSRCRHCTPSPTRSPC